jgi:phosphatidate cytidylyltransferase
MPLNLQAFKTRTLTAIVFAVIMLAGLFWNQWSFIILFTVIHFGCWYEYILLLRKINPQKFVQFLPFGLLYITMPMVMMIHLYYFSVTYHISLHTLFPVIPCAIIFSIWINDTMAYIVGSLIGKTPFSKISAKKTWEGTIGGAILCIVIMAFFGIWNKPYSTTDRILIPALCAVFGTLGDLLESKLKRLAGVKDSGTLMPGHGGFLDRFDSLLVATPFVWLYVYFFIR